MVPLMIFILFKFSSVATTEIKALKRQGHCFIHLGFFYSYISACGVWEACGKYVRMVSVLYLRVFSEFSRVPVTQWIHEKKLWS